MQSIGETNRAASNKQRVKRLLLAPFFGAKRANRADELTSRAALYIGEIRRRGGCRETGTSRSWAPLYISERIDGDDVRRRNWLTFGYVSSHPAVNLIEFLDATLFSLSTPPGGRVLMDQDAPIHNKESSLYHSFVKS